MKILITGRGTSGSFQIRGFQMAKAIGATVLPNAPLEVMRKHDCIILVKRPTADLVADLRRSGARVIHDLVDAWPQPAGNEWPADKMLAWLRQTVEDVQPDGVICATKAMQIDVNALPETVRPLTAAIYHHARAHYVTAPPHARSEVRTVGYEGGRNYLGRFEPLIREECMRRRWAFDTESIAGADVVICLRDAAGYGPRAWKSNIKAANAQALGIPMLCSPEAGYQETTTGGVIWIEQFRDIRPAFDALADPEHYAKMRAAVDRPPLIGDLAMQYHAFIERVCA